MPLLSFTSKSDSWWTSYVPSAAIWTQSPICPPGLQAGIPWLPIWASHDGRCPSSPDVPSIYDHKTRATRFHLWLRYCTIFYCSKAVQCPFSFTIVVLTNSGHNANHSIVLGHINVHITLYTQNNTILNEKIHLKMKWQMYIAAIWTCYRAWSA